MSEETAVYMTAPDKNGTPSLPKRAGARTLLPTTWLDRSVRLEYVGADGRAKAATATLLDWTPIGALLLMHGGKCLLSWDAITLVELQEDR